MTQISEREPVGAHEQREAAIAVCQADRYRGLALLVSSYSQNFNSNLRICRGPVGASLLAIGCEAGAKSMKVVPTLSRASSLLQF